MNGKRIFVDSGVWIAYFEGNLLDRRLQGWLTTNKTYTSLLNLYEVLVWYQQRKPENVKLVAGQIKAQSQLISLDESTTMEGVRLKQLNHDFSTVDALSFAAARKLQAKFLTTDSDFESFPEAFILRVE